MYLHAQKIEASRRSIDGLGAYETKVNLQHQHCQHDERQDKSYLRQILQPFDLEMVKQCHQTDSQQGNNAMVSHRFKSGLLRRQQRGRREYRKERDKEKKEDNDQNDLVSLDAHHLVPGGLYTASKCAFLFHYNLLTASLNCLPLSS